MRNQRIQTLVEIALAIALAAALNLLALRLPINIAGGSISLTMLPIAILALRRGVAAGAVAGTLFGLLDLLMEPFILVPVQVILDYPLPYLLFGGGVGLAAGLYRRVNHSPSPETPAAAPAASPAPFFRGWLSGLIVGAVLLGGLLRLGSHLLSGVFFFAEYAGGENVWIYSLVYNISYLGPSLLAVLILTLILMPILDRAVPLNPTKRSLP